jgi:ParB family chromosome partitioning protein
MKKTADIKQIPLTQIDDFPEHPFSTYGRGQGSARGERQEPRNHHAHYASQKEDGRYEIVSGHRPP